MVKNLDIANKELKDYVNLLKNSYNLFAEVLFGRTNVNLKFKQVYWASWRCL